MRRTAFTAVAAVFLAGAPGAPARAAAPPLELTILVTNDVQGYVEPCG